MYSNDFLPAINQGTLVVPGAEPIANVSPRLPKDRQRLELDALQALNSLHLDKRSNKEALQTRMKSFATAYGMQSAVPEAFDFSKETESTLNSYAIQPNSTAGFGWQCLLHVVWSNVASDLSLIDTGSSAIGTHTVT